MYAVLWLICNGLSGGRGSPTPGQVVALSICELKSYITLELRYAPAP